MREITIDGAKFHLTYPEETMWTETFSRQAAAIDGWSDTDWTFLQKFTQAKSRRRRKARVAGIGHTGGPIKFGILSEMGRDYIGSIGWRPVLIPDTPIDDQESTVFIGGSLYVNNKPLSFIHGKPHVLSNMYPEKKNFKPEEHPITIGDTIKGKEIKWFFWQGNLICTQVLLVHITANELDKLLEI